MPGSAREPATRRDWPGAAAALVCTALATAVLDASAGYTRFGALFPRTVALVMLGLGVAIVLLSLTRPRPVTPRPAETLWRVAGIVAAVALWMGSIPVLGFFAASLLGFALAGLVARHDPWTLRDLGIHALVTLATVSALYLLFLHGLGVRLP
jgi:putative tricarboxylic transport membrane protein